MSRYRGGHFDRQIHRATCHHRTAAVLVRREHRILESDRGQYQPITKQHMNSNHQLNTSVKAKTSFYTECIIK